MFAGGGVGGGLISLASGYKIQNSPDVSLNTLGPLGLNFLFFRQKESLTKKNTTQGGAP